MLSARVFRATLLALVVACTSCGAKSSDASHATRCSISKPVLSDARVRVDHQRFRDALGRLVILRGVDTGGRSKFAPYVPFDFTDFDASLAQYWDRARSWGVDVVRMPFTWAAVEPTQGSDDATFLARYDAMIDAAWSRGIRVVVDFHQDIYAENFCGDGFPAWTIPDPKPAPHHDCPDWALHYTTDKAVESAFDRFWDASSDVRKAYRALFDRIVARYKDRPGVIGFEPLNEPGAGSRKDTNAFEATTLTDFFSEMNERIHAVAPDALVFVDPMGIDGLGPETSLQRPVGDNLVFAPHYHQIESFSTGPVAPDIVLDRLQKWVDVSRSWDVPLFLGEFGASHDLDGVVDYMRAHYDAFDVLGTSSAQWEYSVSKDDWNAESLGLVDANGTEFPVVSALIRPYPRAVAGDAVTSTFDATTATYTLDFTAADGVTEVALPSRAYPGGYDLSLDGACVDDSSSEGELLLKPDANGKPVKLVVHAK